MLPTAGVLVILMWLGVWQGHSGGQGKGGGMAGFHGQGVGGGMSGVRFVGALGRDQTYVSTGNPSYRKGNGRRGGAREGAVPGAGVGPGSGGNRVRFHGELEQDGVPAAKIGVGVEAPNGAQAGQGKTQRDKIIEAGEVLRLLLGQGVCSQVEDLFQEHILPLPKVTPSPIPPLNLSVLSSLPNCLKKKPDLRRKFRGRKTRLAKQDWRCSKAEG